MIFANIFWIREDLLKFKKNKIPIFYLWIFLKKLWTDFKKAKKEKKKRTRPRTGPTQVHRGGTRLLAYHRPMRGLGGLLYFLQEKVISIKNGGAWSNHRSGDVMAPLSFSPLVKVAFSRRLTVLCPFSACLRSSSMLFFVHANPGAGLSRRPALTEPHGVVGPFWCLLPQPLGLYRLRVCDDVFFSVGWSRPGRSPLFELSWGEQPRDSSRASWTNEAFCPRSVVHIGYKLRKHVSKV